MCFPGLSLVKGNSKVCCTVCVLQLVVIPHYFHGFELVDKVKSVVNDLVLFTFTHQSCVQLDRMRTSLVMETSLL